MLDPNVCVGSHAFKPSPSPLTPHPSQYCSARQLSWQFIPCHSLQRPPNSPWFSGPNGPSDGSPVRKGREPIQLFWGQAPKERPTSRTLLRSFHPEKAHLFPALPGGANIAWPVGPKIKSKCANSVPNSIEPLSPRGRGGQSAPLRRLRVAVKQESPLTPNP